MVNLHFLSTKNSRSAGSKSIATINPFLDMNGFLSARMSVLARNILCPKPCSLCLYVCNGLPRQAHPPKVKYSLSAVYEQAIRQNILLCEDVLVLEDHYIHTSKENKALDTEYFWPIQTYIRAKREREGVHIIRLWGKTMFWSSQFQNYGW